MIILTLLSWLNMACAAAPVVPAALEALCSENPDPALARRENTGFVPAEAVTNALPAEGDARIAYRKRLDTANPQRFRIFEPDSSAQPSVVSAVTLANAANGDYPVGESVLLHVWIPRQSHSWPLFHRRDFIVVECSASQFRSWASVQAYVTSPEVAYLWIPVSVTVFLLSTWAVYRSRKSLLNGKTEGKLAEKYPSVFAVKQFERLDFINPIQLTANAFNQASVQKFQVLMFSFIVGSLVLSLVLRTGALTDLSGTVVGLLGISGIGAAVSQITYTSKTRLSFENWAWLETNGALKQPEHRGPQWKDLVLTNREFDVYKLQTIVFSVAVAVALIIDGAAHLATFEVPPTMLQILGLSQVVFVGGILVRPPATEDLDKALTKLRDAAQLYTEAVVRSTDTDEKGKLLPGNGKEQDGPINARRQYEQLVDSIIPMIESTLEVEVDEAALREAPLRNIQKWLQKKTRIALSPAWKSGDDDRTQGRMANLNERDAMALLVALARTFANNNGVARDKDEALRLIRTAAAQAGVHSTERLEAMAVQQLMDTGTQTAPTWSSDDDTQAAVQGWRIVDHGATKRIGRIEGNMLFASDEEAAKHVNEAAANNDQLATRAVAFLMSVNGPAIAQ